MIDFTFGDKKTNNSTEIETVTSPSKVIAEPYRLPFPHPSLYSCAYGTGSTAQYQIISRRKDDRPLMTVQAICIATRHRLHWPSIYLISNEQQLLTPAPSGRGVMSESRRPEITRNAAILLYFAQCEFRDSTLLDHDLKNFAASNVKRPVLTSCPCHGRGTLAHHITVHPRKHSIHPVQQGITPLTLLTAANNDVF